VEYDKCDAAALVSSYKVIEVMIYDKFPKFYKYKKGLNLWIMKDNSEEDKQRPKAVSDLNEIVKVCMNTNRILVELKKHKLSELEYKTFVKKANMGKRRMLVEKGIEPLLTLDSRVFLIKTFALVTSINPLVVWI